MRPVAPRVGVPEVTVAEEQLEYAVVTAAVVRYQDGTISLLTRWKLDDDERALIARGEDLYLEQLTFGQPMQPINPRIGQPEWAPSDAEENRQ